MVSKKVQREKPTSLAVPSRSCKYVQELKKAKKAKRRRKQSEAKQMRRATAKP